MTNEALQDLIGSWFPNTEASKVSEVTVEEVSQKDDNNQDNNKTPEPINPSLLHFNQEESQFLNIDVPAQHLHNLMRQLRSNELTLFDYLFCLTGMDWGEELGVVYHLESTNYRHSIVVKVKTDDRENPNIDSVSDIWATANFHEREAFEFFGIKFNNHPNLKHLILTEEWDGFPLRKDYIDEINMVIK